MKSLTLVAAIIVITALFVVPTIRDQQIDDRFEGQPFPTLRPEHAFQPAEFQPAVGRSTQQPAVAESSPLGITSPVVTVVPQDHLPTPTAATLLETSAESEALFDFSQDTVDQQPHDFGPRLQPAPELTAAEFGMSFAEANGKLQVAEVEPNRAADAYGVEKDDVLLLLDDEKLTSEADFHRVATQKAAGDTANLILLRGQKVVAIEAMQLGADGQIVTPPDDFAPTIEAVDNLPGEHRDILLANPFEAPIVTEPEFALEPEAMSMLQSDARTRLARIYSGQSSPTDDQYPQVAFNPFVSKNESASKVPNQRQRPIAWPRFDQTSTSVPTEVSDATTDPAATSQAEASPSIQAEGLPFDNVSREVLDPESSLHPLAVTPMPDAQETPTLAEPTLAPLPTDDRAVQSQLPTSIQPQESSVVATQVPSPFDSVSPEAGITPPSPASNGEVSSNVPNGATPVEQSTSNYDVMRHPSPMQILEGMPGPVGGCVSCPAATVPACDCDACDSHGLLHDWGLGHDEPAFSVGGWLSAGYYSESNDLFNSRPDKFALHQGWLYAERNATATNPIGFRVEAMYGVDADDTQAFGNNDGEYDYLNGLDFGSYGWAFPQAYVELVLGEWNIRAGHFFTLLGYETVPTPDNFFYSHAMTMYNSEPFTHTGVLVNRKFGDFDVFAGWTLGWDTGFDQFGDGSSWLGGVSYEINDCASLAYFSTAGNFGRRGDDGYSQSVVLDLTLTEKMNYVLQSDYLRVSSTGEDNVGINQYATYSLTDKVAVGSRLEWWKGDVLTGYAPHNATLPAAGSLSYFAATFGVNVRPTETLVLRPEVRQDWSPAADYDETYFGVDAVWSF